MTHADPRRFFPAARFGDVRELAPISMGLSGSAVYSVATETGDYVLRIHAPGASDWDSMMRWTRLAAEHGIAPRVVHVDDAELAAVSVKIGGMPFAAAMGQPAVRPAALRSLADRLGCLHAIPAEEIAPTDPVAFARSLWNEQTRRPGFPGWAEPLGEKVSAAGDVLARDTRRVLSHGDVHPANLIWDGSQVWLVDWERAGLAHPYRDMATFANLTNRSDDDALGLLALQERGEIGGEYRATFVCLREYLRVVYGAVFLRLVPDLAVIPFTSRAETPTLAECYRKMADGALDLTSASGKALLGAALLREVST